MGFSVDRIAVIGLGYVGLPIAVEFSKKFDVIGFDINDSRIQELNRGVDSTNEVELASLEKDASISFSSNISDLAGANIFIVTVPTPIDIDRRPDLSPLLSASNMIGRILTKGSVVVYESTVYPGATEEVCVPEIEKASGMTFNKDFFVGYSPERINPGDKDRPVSKIMKVTSGSTEEVADFVDAMYSSIISAGTYKAVSIRVAEASKVIENTQRDVNIALINELAMIFDNLGIRTADVLSAAATKWNFINLKPGLVGGHCIGVDPYYLVHKSMAAGYIPDIIRTSREINDAMPKFVVGKLVKGMIRQGRPVKGARALILGLSFKENCSDIRNTKVVDLVSEMADYGMDLEIYDPIVSPSEVKAEYGLSVSNTLPGGGFDVIVMAVAHDDFKDNFRNIVESCGDGVMVFDLKGIVSSDVSNENQMYL